MTDFSRRDLLKWAGLMAAAMGLSASQVPALAEGLEEMVRGHVPVLWLQAQSCSGCSISTLNAQSPRPLELLTQLISLRFHPNLSAATGADAMAAINSTIQRGDYWLVVEGTIPVAMPSACVIGDEPATTLVARAATSAKAIIAMGTCSVYGGIPAAEGNSTGATSLRDFLKQQNIDTPTVSLPGCPPHPDWLLGTLVHLERFGLPPMDADGRPAMFYSRLVHDQCPRFPDYERERFATRFGDDGCLFKLGCMGPNTYADCTQRLWNAGTSSCIRAGAPCIGCASREFAAKASFPMFRTNTARLTVGGRSL